MKKVFSGLIALVMCFSSFARMENIKFSDKVKEAQLTSSITSLKCEEGDDVTEFLKNYYNKNYSLGRSAESMFGEESVTITEVLLENSEVINGYIVVSNTGGKLLYFMDVDKANFTITAIDILQKETSIIKGLNKVENFNFDFISFIKEKELNNDPASSAARFWGWQCGPEFSIEPGSCYRNCSYYILWQSAGTDVHTCSELPGRNPKLVN